MKLFKLSKVGSFDCSNKNTLNPAPKFGFKGLSPGVVRKKINKIFFITFWVK